MFTFLKEAFTNIQQTGSIMESSAQLSRKMVDVIDFKKSLQLVELGAGTGNMTRLLLEEMNEDSKLTSFEINPVLFLKLKHLEDKRLVRLNENVLTASKYLKDHSVDYILSGLPLANIAKSQKIRILNLCHNMLKPGGLFIQFQYSLNDLELIKKKFSEVSIKFELINLPPAFVYYSKK